MARALNNIKKFIGGGLDTDSAPEYIQGNDYIFAQNVRTTGTEGQQLGYATDIESTEAVTETTDVPAGIIKGIGGREFDSVEKAVTFRYNSFGYHQILVYDYSSNDFRAIYTDLTDSDGIPLMPLDPQFYISNNILLIHNEYLVWTDGQSSIGFTNLTKLINGDYGTITAEDFSLIKPQPLPPITGYYSDDAGKASNFLKSKLFQFNAMWFGKDYTSSAWSTWSKRIIPDEEATPSVGDDVSKNNCIILTVPIGSDRVQTINIGARYGNFNFNIIKSVDRTYVLSLPFTSVDVAEEILEAYDPTTQTYSFVFYNDSVAIPVAPTETDLPYDYVPLTAGCCEVLNGDIIALGDVTEGYVRPTTSVSISATGYDPNLTVPPDEDATDPPFIILDRFAGDSGSGEGDHKRRMFVGYTGTPHTGDVLSITLADIRDANNSFTYAYAVQASQDEDLLAVMTAFAATVNNSNLTIAYIPELYITMTFVGPSYFGMQSASISLFNDGAEVSKSIHALLDNSSYQMALSYRDVYGRFFPLLTNNDFIQKTPSFAQTQGQAVQIQWTINDAEAPEGAVDYQWVITKNATTQKVLDVLGNPLDYKGAWNAHTNSPTLAANVGTVGDAYQITVPNLPDDDPPINLGNGAIIFNTGDYVVYNGKTWDVVDKNFANISDTSNVWVFKLNPLALFNTTFANVGSTTVLNYDYSQNDRCTLHYYYDGSDKVWLNDPCVELGVLGYDPTTYLVKVTKSSMLDLADISGKDVYLRLSTPKQQVSGDTEFSAQTIWYEIGERFTITDGVHDVLTGAITDGDVYFKTRQFQGAVDPDVSYPVLATDFNFSDFYESEYTSYGRPRSYNDVLEQTERKAIIRHSQNFITGSRNNGLTRFFAEAIYGEADGQTSSSWGAIGALWQRGPILVIIQETNLGYAPINLSILEDAIQQKQYAISQKLINNIRYNQTGNIGIGRAKESFCFYDNMGWFIDPNRSAPIQIGLDGLNDISYKMSKYFKEVIQQAYRAGKKLVMYYDRYYKEVVFCTGTEGGILTKFSFSDLSWNVLDGYDIAPGDITPADGSHSTVSYNSGTGIATYTPDSGYVGNDVAEITFDVDGSPVTKNVCLNWTEGTTDVNPFYFAAQVDLEPSTLVYSNTILVGGNTIPVAISITGGQYSINGGSWTSAAGTVNAGDTVQVRQTTSAIQETETTATLTIGSQSADFDATTKTMEFSLTVTLVEQEDPYSDAGCGIKLNGVDVARLTNSGTYPYTLSSRLPLSLEAFSELPSTGSNPTKTMVITVNGTEVFNDTEPNNPGDPSLLWNSYTPQDDDVIVATVTAEATAFPADVTGILVVDIYVDTTLNVIGYVNTAGTIPYQIPAYTGVNFTPNDGTPPENCYVLSSDVLAGPPVRRFEFNVAALLSLYPAETMFEFIISGRSLSPGTIGGQYNLKGADAGKMIMSGSPGSYIPSTSGTTNIGIVPYSGKAVVGGADGTYGLGVGAVILTFQYDVAAKTMTLL